TSPLRLYAESWDAALLEKRTRDAVSLAKGAGLECTFVTEDTVRSHPKLLGRLFRAAIDEGVDGLCLCDTVGHATPDGVRDLIGYTRMILETVGATKVGIDWHGHNDRGLGVTNNIIAIEAGADRIHGTALGIGERVGNAALDQTLMNLKLLGALEGHDLRNLVEWCTTVARACDVPIHFQYPLVGEDAFRTATGVHAAAIIKAIKKGDEELADRVYSGVPAGWFGKSQAVEVGFMSGESNVVFWLERRGIEATPARVRAVFDHAKSCDHILSDDEIHGILNALSTP
ncbi:MAG: 2-isopropylmalate synthase, partial [Nannocystaceae bacterium]